MADATQALVEHLRSDLVPRGLRRRPRPQVYVTGNTAVVVDYLGFFDTWLPIALARGPHA